MSQLAYNYKGQRFTPPTEARFWRVRRLREGQRGQLDVVRGVDGRPLIVPIDVDVEGFRIAVNDQAGRYRLDALDEHEMVLASVDAAYVTVPMPAPRTEVEEIDTNEAAAVDSGPGPIVRNGFITTEPARPTTVTAPFGTWPALPMPAAMTGTEYLLAEALRGQVQMFQMVTAALASQGASASAGASQMMNAAAELVRAADGAAMPRRPPPPAPVLPPPTTSGPAPGLPPIVLAAPGALTARNAAPESDAEWDEDDDDGDADDDADDAEPAADADVFAKMITLADKVQGVIAPVADVARLVMGGMGGVRNAASHEDSADEAGGDEAQTSTAIDVAHLRTSHILLIAHELGEDGSLFRRLLMAMEPEDRQTWTDRLCAMNFEDAVDEVASKLERIKARQARSARRTARSAEASGDVAGGNCGRASAAAESDQTPDAERDQDASDGLPSGESSDGAQDGGDDAEEENDRASELEPAGQPNGNDAVDDENDASGESEMEVSDDGENHSAPATDASSPAVGAATTMPSPAAVQARMMEIAKHLRVPEILQVQRMIAQLGTTERDAWIARLMAMSAAEAAQAVRAELMRRRPH
ncbi:MAG TPA: hypothetical protein VHE35_21450 [Kofleriaceae bacterium]|nr:hypothetical protein [Kofleriaceae bacterium]